VVSATKTDVYGEQGDVLDSSIVLADDLPELPDNKANLMLAYGQHKGLRAEIKVGYVDGRGSTQGNLTSTGGSYLAEIDGSFDVDASVSYLLYRGQADRELRVRLAANNLLDEEIVEEYGYPMPGMTVMANVRAVF
jgi:hypothetical protein